MRTEDVTWYKTPMGEEVYCNRCHADAYWVDCDNCEDGYSHHDCGEDTCCCLNPVNNVECDVCDGEGGWYICQGCGKYECTCEPYAYEPTIREKLGKAAKDAKQIMLTEKLK